MEFRSRSLMLEYMDQRAQQHMKLQREAEWISCGYAA